MSGVGIIFRREMAQYFTSPVYYLIAAAFLFLTGFTFNAEVTLSVTVRPLNPAIVPVSLAFFLVFFAPLLTMRALAEETREGTLELLLTAPVNGTAIVIGKFLSAWAFYTLLLFVTLAYQIVLFTLMASPPDLGSTLSAYIGIWLYGGATLAIGLFFSSLTENQIVAAFLSMAALIVLWLGDIAGQVVANIDLARVIRNLTLPGHFSSSFAVGVVRAEDIAYFAGIMVIMLFLTIRMVEGRRWR
jgi:ABC-2 type transport system permease protein